MATTVETISIKIKITHGTSKEVESAIDLIKSRQLARYLCATADAVLVNATPGCHVHTSPYLSTSTSSNPLWYTIKRNVTAVKLAILSTLQRMRVTF